MTTPSTSKAKPAHVITRLSNEMRASLDGYAEKRHITRSEVIRFTQAILGHEELSTTQIYTQVAIRVLKDVHAATHPGGRRRRAPYTKPAEIGEAQQLASLLATLDGEAIEEAGDAQPGATWH